MTPFWIRVNQATLAQGDYLPGCLAPVFPLDYDTAKSTTAELERADLIIVPQSCDLANLRVGFVVLCPIHTIARFEELNPILQEEGAVGTGAEGASGGPPS